MKDMLRDSRAYTNKNIEKLREMMEAMNDQYRKEMESMKPVQTDIQEINNSIENIGR